MNISISFYLKAGLIILISFFVAMPVFAVEDETLSQSNDIGIVEKVSNVIPDGVKRRAGDATFALESFRIKQAGALNYLLESAKSQIEEENSEEEIENNDNLVKENKESLSLIWLQVKMVGLSVISFVFSNKILFYVVLILFVVITIRNIFRRFRRPSWEE